MTIHVIVHAGDPRTANGMRVAMDVFAERCIYPGTDLER